MLYVYQDLPSEFGGLIGHTGFTPNESCITMIILYLHTLICIYAVVLGSNGMPFRFSRYNDMVFLMRNSTHSHQSMSETNGNFSFLLVTQPLFCICSRMFTLPSTVVQCISEKMVACFFFCPLCYLEAECPWLYLWVTNMQNCCTSFCMLFISLFTVVLYYRGSGLL